MNNLDADFDEQVVEGKVRVVGTRDGDLVTELRNEISRLTQRAKNLDDENQQLRRQQKPGIIHPVTNIQKLFGDDSNEDGDSAGMLAVQLTKLSESVAEATEAFKIVSGDKDSGPVTEANYQRAQTENAKLRGLVQHVSAQLQDLQALSQKAAYLQQCRYVR